MAKILFLTDSAADIPKSLREELGIRVMPFPIAMGERELRDGEDFTPQEFYQALAEEPKIPTHAQLTAYQFQQCYEETWKAGYTDLIYTSINSEGSATYQNAVQARGEFFEDHPEAGSPSPPGHRQPHLYHVLRLPSGRGGADGCRRRLCGGDRRLYPGLGGSCAGALCLL